MYRVIKRIIDFMAAVCGLLFLSWLFLGIALIIKLTSKGPVFFKQERIGIHKSRIGVYKFRTMRTDAPHDIPTHLLENPEQYVTGIGRFLRKSSLDELPQLINILKGEMSVIGPRPALWNQEDLVAERDKFGANDVLPGLSGWAQINGRDELPINTKAALDGEYVKQFGLKMDIRCFFGSIFAVLKGDGVIEGSTLKPEEQTDGIKQPETVVR